MPKPEVEIKTYVEQIDKLLPSEHNPRKIGRREYDQLKKSLRDFPEMKRLREIVVDEGLRVLGGHQRLYALKDLGYADVTVKQVFGLTEKQKREFIIKDNVASGSWDSDILANEWDIKELEDFGVPDFNLAGSEQSKEPAAKESTPRTHTCPECGAEFED